MFWNKKMSAEDVKKVSEEVKMTISIVKLGIKHDTNTKLLLGFGAVGSALAIVKGAGLLGVVSGAALVVGFSQGLSAGIREMMENQPIDLPVNPFVSPSVDKEVQ